MAFIWRRRLSDHGFSEDFSGGDIALYQVRNSTNNLNEQYKIGERNSKIVVLVTWILATALLINIENVIIDDEISFK